MSQAVVLVVVALLPVLWAGCESEERPGAKHCLTAPEGSPSGEPGPAAVALLGDELDEGFDLVGSHQSRLLRVALPGGEIEAERALGPRLPRSAVTRSESFRLNVARAPLLAATRDARTVVALLRKPAPRRESVVVLDAVTLATRCVHALAEGVRYIGVALGRSGRVYAYGSRMAGAGGPRDAVVTMVDADAGGPATTTTLRTNARDRPPGSGSDWLIYGAALRRDERELAVTYHGSNSTGMDRFRVSKRGRVFHPGRWPCVRRPGGGPCLPGVTDNGDPHGGVVAVGSGFVATAGERGLLRYDRRGRLVRRVEVQPNSHLMDIAADPGRSLVYVSRCGARPAIQRFDLERGHMHVIRGARFCGQPLAAHGERFVALVSSRRNKAGYVAGPPRRLAVVDLDRAGSGERVRRPGVPVAAVILRR